MKKKTLVISTILLAMISMNMAGCGKEEPAGPGTETVIRLEGEIGGIILNGGMDQEPTEISEPDEPVPEDSNDKIFECLPEIGL